VAQAVSGAEPTVDARLRGPALADDWAAWVKAWDTLDAGPLAAVAARVVQGTPARLTLCGERSWAAFEAAPRGLLQRVRGLWSQPAVLPLLEKL
jgi:hypothetical protein